MALMKAAESFIGVNVIVNVQSRKLRRYFLRIRHDVVPFLKFRSGSGTNATRSCNIGSENDHA
ncbi:hypothetical protein COLO4_33251 [Corchorus olitorius]|uniref:Uncharacterized protein n=1 Tax=Corchorus olitorius TaxID=93759 RepID=A0A1R3GV92_9ROSI|nr:hypothetical protein COLO4_33251 [Corchorus olitorius]